MLNFRVFGCESIESTYFLTSIYELCNTETSNYALKINPFEILIHFRKFSMNLFKKCLQFLVICNFAWGNILTCLPQFATNKIRHLPCIRFFTNLWKIKNEKINPTYLNLDSKSWSFKISFRRGFCY